MKNKRVTLIALSVAMVFVLIAGVGIGVKVHMDRQKQELRERQINYLKKHEKEIVDYIKEQNPRVTSVSIDWSQTNTGTIGNGLPQGSGEAIRVFGKFNNHNNSGWTIQMDLDKEHMPIMESMSLDSLSIGGKVYD
ncbi:hypothetical protein Q2T76_01925 [Lactobacillus sp. YT155]|uniref:hypothetical protein n=1 Tax=Lactobacillus sp. YT155 TaxID=3060955 RepID=UPI00265F011E|nr:hypothetical protein [Lactobacillus sp. YT155]MDO1604807.1 hypothetical protein [Lactobacillus sp. YT155]